MEIKIFDSGCCNKGDLLYAHTQEALVELGITENIKRHIGYDEMLALGIMSSPALVIDGKVVSSGRVLTSKKVKGLIEDARNL